MKTNFFTLIILLVTVLNVHSQSLVDARQAFDRFDYKLAAEYFDHVIREEKKLALEDIKRITYSYYVVGNYEKCKPFSDSLIENPKIEKMFYLINGEVNRGLSNYVKAIESYEKYQAENGEEDVSLKIEACREIPNWDDEKYIEFMEKDKNTVMADFVGGVSSHGVISFSEGGFNYKKNRLDLKNAENSTEAELLMSVPFFKNSDELGSVSLVDSNYASITSMSFMPDNETAIITVSYPLEESALLKAPNLYWVKYDSIESKLYDLKPFEYSGLLDTSSTAHATINESGNKMVFTKMSQRTSESDLFYTELVEGEWLAPEPLSNINTKNNELFPLFSGDSILTFSSDGRLGYGELDIYSAKFEGVETRNVTHFKFPINSVKDDFNLTYMSSDSAMFASNRNGGTGDDDIYFIMLKDSEKIAVDTFDVDKYISEWGIKSVYFEFDKFSLRKALSDDNIRDLKFILDKEPNCKIHLVGFTDSRGSMEYNKKLGLKRAESVKNALKKQGLNVGQVELTSMGENNQPNNCNSGCSEEGHKLNRVVQIKLEYR